MCKDSLFILILTYTASTPNPPRLSLLNLIPDPNHINHLREGPFWGLHYFCTSQCNHRSKTNQVPRAGLLKGGCYQILCTRPLSPKSSWILKARSQTVMNSTPNFRKHEARTWPKPESYYGLLEWILCFRQINSKVKYSFSKSHTFLRAYLSISCRLEDVTYLKLSYF